MSTSATGRFWICPECHKHVPIRIDACKCGFDRSALPGVRMREVSSHVVAPAPERGSFAWVPWTAVALLLGWIGYTQFAKELARVPTTTSGARSGSPAAAPLKHRLDWDGWDRVCQGG